MRRGEDVRRRLAGQVRRWRPDRNPLRRTVDRVEAAILAVLCAGFLVATPLAALTTGRWAAAAGLRAERAQAGWRQVRADLLRPAPSLAHITEQRSLYAKERARWTAPDGARRGGEIFVPNGAGSRVLIWVDREGRVTGPPVRPVDVAEQVAVAAVVTCLAFAGALIVVGSMVRLAANRRRFHAWAEEWSSAGPQWTGRR